MRGKLTAGGRTSEAIEWGQRGLVAMADRTWQTPPLREAVAELLRESGDIPGAVAIVAPRTADSDGGVGKPIGSWLIMGDAKDYERVRSPIDDQRMLKGFLQVALGAESAAAWSALPSGMVVHESGALAVPR